MNARSSLATPVVFVAGILAGLGGGWFAGVALEDPALDPGLSVLAGDAPRGETASSLGSESAPAARVETGTESGSAAVPAETGSQRSDAAHSAQLGAGGVDGLLLRTMQELLAEHPEQMLGMLIDRLLEQGDPQGALALLREYPTTNAWQMTRVANALVEAGDVAAANALHADALRLDPLHSDSLEYLLESDPSLALVVVRESLAWQPPPGNPTIRTLLARALLAAGQDQEARELVAELRASGLEIRALDDLYLKLEPEAAEAEIRARLKTEDPDERSTALHELAGLLAKSERREELLETLSLLLELAPQSGYGRRLLMEHDPRAALEFLTTRSIAEPGNSGVWNDLGSVLFDQGRLVDALDAWEHSVTLAGNRRALDSLMKHAPERAWRTFETFTEASGDDEMWGDLADMYWTHDRHDDARRGWEKAWELDPTDGEWYGKLQALQHGRDPLGD